MLNCLTRQGEPKRDPEAERDFWLYDDVNILAYIHTISDISKFYSNISRPKLIFFIINFVFSQSKFPCIFYLHTSPQNSDCVLSWYKHL